MIGRGLIGMVVSELVLARCASMIVVMACMFRRGMPATSTNFSGRFAVRMNMHMRPRSDERRRGPSDGDQPGCNVAEWGHTESCDPPILPESSPRVNGVA
jgi:hypothetical protein